jgi:hypothetical protein
MYVVICNEWHENEGEFPPRIGNFLYRPKYDKSYAAVNEGWVLLSEDSNRGIKETIDKKYALTFKRRKKKVNLNFIM